MSTDSNHTIVIFGSSGPGPGTAGYVQAYDLGKALALAGYRIANGGYGGTMAACAQGAKEAGGSTTGVTCEIFGRSGPNQWIDQEIKTRDLSQRLETLINLAEIKTPTSNDTFYAADCLLSELRLAVSSEPAKWLGNLGDPKNPEMQERRERAKARNLKALH